MPNRPSRNNGSQDDKMLLLIIAGVAGLAVFMHRNGRNRNPQPTIMNPANNVTRTN